MKTIDVRLCLDRFVFVFYRFFFYNVFFIFFCKYEIFSNNGHTVIGTIGVVIVI